MALQRQEMVISFMVQSYSILNLQPHQESTISFEESPPLHQDPTSIPKEPPSLPNHQEPTTTVQEPPSLFTHQESTTIFQELPSPPTTIQISLITLNTFKKYNCLDVSTEN